MKAEDVRTANDVRRIVEEQNVQHATIGLTDTQGLLRGKYVSRDKLLSVLEHDWGMAPLVLALDFDDVIMEAPLIADSSYGYGDGTARLLPETCREIPWESPRRNLLFLAEFSGNMERICPRGIYRRIEQKARDMGFLPYHALEYEFTLFEETALSAFEKGYRDLKPATPLKTYEVLLRQAVWTDFYDDLLDTFQHMNVPLETAHEEMAPGFMEASLSPQVGVAAADSASIFKTYTKAIAQRRGMLISFMARWSNEVEGQGGHVHVSLKDLDGRPVFHDPDAEGNMSRTMRLFLGGMQALMPELLLMLGPNVNSFKRYVPGIFAPIAATWGLENRTCALRVIPGAAESQRIECRTPGADANPYLALACLVGAGLHGIEHEIEPSEPTVGNSFEQPVPKANRFPESFSVGIERFRNSREARELFGDDFVEIYAATRDHQDREFRARVTDADLHRFFEMV